MIIEGVPYYPFVVRFALTNGKNPGRFRSACEGEMGKVEERDVYMINVNKFSGSVFVKALDFFRSQGGFREEWGTHWVPIVATSIEDARERGCSLPHARPYDQQAKA